LSKNIKVFFVKDKILYVCEMLITKEQQEAMIEVYAQTHSAAEVLGYYDGMIAMLELIERLDKNGK
jgi:hypothetical protein